MNKIIAAVCVTAIAATSFGANLAPAAAAPLNQGEGQFQLAQYHRGDRPRFEQHGTYALYNGHRGYRTRHQGYRQYNGYWFPPSAFIGAAIGGAVIGGIIHSIR